MAELAGARAFLGLSDLSMASDALRPRAEAGRRGSAAMSFVCSAGFGRQLLLLADARLEL